MIQAGRLSGAGIPRIADVLAELREERIDIGSELAKDALDLWFNAPTDRYCSARGCRNPLRRFEVLNGHIAANPAECWPCTEARIRRIKAATDGQPRYAR